MTNTLREVKLDATLCEAAEKMFAARFGGLEPFLNSLLEQLTSNEAATMDENERKIVEKRLKDLGYI
jgi:hypothetical protein